MKKILLTILLSGPVIAADYSTEITSRQKNFQHLDATSDHLDDLFSADILKWEEIIPLAKSAYLTVEEQKGLFPKGSADNSRARTKIWQQKPEFQATFTELSEQFQRLDKAAQRKDEAAARQALDAAYSQCRSCHMNYRSLW